MLSVFKKKWKNQRKNISPKVGVLVIASIAVIQIAYLLVFNILRMETEVNMDSSSYLVQVLQIYRQKTLLIEDYYYSTALMWDMPTLLAVLFYAVIKDIFLAWGLSVDVFLIILAVVIYRLCTKLGYSAEGKWISILAVFTVYDFGLVDYADILLVNGATYLVRIIAMLLLIDVVIRCHDDAVAQKRRMALYFVVLLVLYICGISTGMFALGCYVFPIFLYEACLVLKKESMIRIKDLFYKPFLMTAGAVFAVLAGIVTNRLLGLPQSQEASKLLLAAEQMPQQLGQNIAGMLKLFGWPEGGTLLFSGAGILALLSLAVFAVWWIVFVTCTVLVLKKKGGRNTETTEAGRIFAGMSACVFLVNFTLFLVVDLAYGVGVTFEYRYWIVPVILGLLEIGLFWELIKDKIGLNYRWLLIWGFTAILLLVNLRNDVRLWQSGDWTYPLLDAHKKAMEEIVNEEVDTVFVYSNFYRSRIICVNAPDGVELFAVTMEAEDGKGNWIRGKLSMPRWANYVKYDGDCLEMPDSCRAGILLDKTIGYDAEFLMARAAKEIPIGDSELVLLVMDENLMDFVQGVPVGVNSVSRDYFNQGYTLGQVDVNADGCYQSKDEKKAVLLDGEFEATEQGTYQAVLRYEVLESTGTKSGELVITVVDENGREKVYKVELEADLSEVSLQGIELAQGERYSIEISQTDGTKMALDYIEFLKKKAE